MLRVEEANGRISQVLTVLSMELERSDCPSGDTPRDVIVSWWPRNVYDMAFLRKSQTCSDHQPGFSAGLRGGGRDTLMSLSIPPLNISFPASLIANAVTGKPVSM